MGRAPCCSKEGLKKGPWSAKEDLLLTNYIQQHGEGQWRSLPKKAGLLRCGKSCRLRWMNYLRPGIKRGNFSPEEEDLIVRLHSLLGNRWSLIAGRLPGRTDNEIKNFWNTHLLKKLKIKGIQPKSPISKPSKKKISVKKPNKKIRKISTVDHEKIDQTVEKRTPIYAPKPIRLSQAQGHSCASSTTKAEESESGSGVGTTSFIPWDLYELGDVDFCDQIMDGCDLSTSPNCSGPTSDDLLEKVYDEYLQLLTENCFDGPDLSQFAFLDDNAGVNE